MHHSNMIDQGPLDLSHIMSPRCPVSTFLSASTVECSALGNKKAIVATKIWVGTKQGENNWMAESCSELCTKINIAPWNLECSYASVKKILRDFNLNHTSVCLVLHIHAHICYLNDFLRESGLQPLQMFPVTDQQVKHVTGNLSHGLVPKLQKGRSLLGHEK